MYKPSEPISNLKGVGSKVENYLKATNIKKIGDLLNYFPFRYEDLSQINTVGQVTNPQFNPNEKAENKGKVVLKGQFNKIGSFYTRNKKFIVKAKFYDETGSIDIMWFNSQYILKQLNEENEYLLTAKVSAYKGKVNIINPSVDYSNKTSNANTARIVPVYFNIAGITLRTLRKLIKEAVENTEIQDFLQNTLNLTTGNEQLMINSRKENSKNLGILNLRDAYLNLHFPNTFKLIDEAKDRIALNELIHIKLHSIKVREIAEKQKSNFTIKHNYMGDFIKTIPFKLTTDQVMATDTINNLMQKKYPANVLVSGDVGSGKTIVAIINAFNTVKNGGRVVYIAPTVILAEQVYAEFCKYLQNLELTISSEKLKVGQETDDNGKREKDKLSIKLITSKTSCNIKANNRENPKREYPYMGYSLKDYDVLIGTHALLNVPNIENFANLVIIDEQHKFGVKQRAKLVENTLNTRPHVITMTATPIPRSLALTYFNELTIIPINTAPLGRIPITTKVLTQTLKQNCLKWVKEKVINTYKTYYIVPFIDKSKCELFADIKSIEETEAELKKYFGKNKVWVLHGKLKDKEKVEIINDFKNKKGGVLLSTQVVEVGIDIKDASVIIIESAERFGLASLHQLRGRVGRSNIKSYCFLSPSKPTGADNARLKNLEKETNGFKLAEMDLKTRGSGEIFGIRQSGELDLKFVDFSNKALINYSSTLAEKIYKNKELFNEYKKNYLTRDIFDIKDN